MNHITQTLKTIALALILSFGISYVAAWTAPTATPPSGNTSAPVNVSATSQYKDGAFGIGGMLHGYSVIRGSSNIRSEGQESGPFLPGTGVGSELGVGIDSTNGSNFAYLQGFNRTTPGYAPLHLYGDRLEFHTANSGIQTEIMRITGSGNVGIGTSNPAQKLDVVGSIRASGSICNTAGQCVGAASGVTSVNGQTGPAVVVNEVGTGLSGILAPLKGKTISCYVPGWVSQTFSAKVDTAGVPYLSWQGGLWEYGTFKTTTNGCNGTITLNWDTTKLQVIASSESCGGNPGASCVAYWPAN